MSCSHTTQRIQPGVTYQGVASVLECPWCKCDALAADKADLVRVLGVADARIRTLEAALRHITHIGPLGIDTYQECYRLIQIEAEKALASAPETRGDEPCRIYEYDGAFKCYAHGITWGAVTNPAVPCKGWTEPDRKTRRTLLARGKALEAALREIAGNGNVPPASRKFKTADYRAGYVSGYLAQAEIAKAALTAEPPIAQSKSQQKRFEGVVPFAEETKVMHNKCEHGKGLGDHCEPCGDDDDTQTV